MRNKTARLNIGENGATAPVAHPPRDKQRVEKTLCIGGLEPLLQQDQLLLYQTV